MPDRVFSRRALLAASGVLLSSSLPGTPRQQAPSLKETCKNTFLIGTALDFRSPDEFNSTELEIIKTQFNVITPENSMSLDVSILRRTCGIGRSPMRS
jgi:hypothetical protein